MRNSCSGWRKKGRGCFFFAFATLASTGMTMLKIIFAMVSHVRQWSLQGTAFQSGRFNAGDQFLSKNDKLIRPCRGMSKAKKFSTLHKIQFSALALHKLDCWIFSWLRCVSSFSLAAGINWRRSNFMQFNGLENILHSKNCLLTDVSAFFACFSIKSDKFWRVIGCRPGLRGEDALLEKTKPKTFFFHWISEFSHDCRRVNLP